MAGLSSSSSSSSSSAVRSTTGLAMVSLRWSLCTASRQSGWVAMAAASCWRCSQDSDRDGRGSGGEGAVKEEAEEEEEQLGVGSSENAQPAPGCSTRRGGQGDREQRGTERGRLSAEPGAARWPRWRRWEGEEEWRMEVEPSGCWGGGGEQQGRPSCACGPPALQPPHRHRGRCRAATTDHPQCRLAAEQTPRGRQQPQPQPHEQSQRTAERGRKHGRREATQTTTAVRMRWRVVRRSAESGGRARRSREGRA